MVQTLVASGAVSRGAAARKLVAKFCAASDAIPRDFWSVAEAGVDEASEPSLLMRGAVLVKAKRLSSVSTPSTTESSDLRAAVAEKPLHAGRELVRALFRSGPWIWPALLSSVGFASAGVIMEALLFRGLLDISAILGLAGQRGGAAGAVIVFSLALLLLEWPAFAAAARLGRIFENRFRIAFLSKVPRLADRYFQSRPISDLAERSHVIHRLRNLPYFLQQFLSACAQVLFTAAGIVWLEPRAWPYMLASIVAALIPVFSSHFVLADRDLRVRTHSGGLMRFYLDAMLGLIPIRSHGAAAPLRAEQRSLLQKWSAASFRLQRAVVLTQAIQLIAMFGLVIALLGSHTYSGAEIGRVLLLAYWALNMPALGDQLAMLARQYPAYRNITLRLLEPLAAPEERGTAILPPLTAAPAIEYRNVSVVVAGTPILRDISIAIPAGAQVAVVGPSGAGKSTLAGLLLGWLQPASGEILLNGQVLNPIALRSQIAWIDTAVQLWNRTLHQNLTYGTETAAMTSLVDIADLRKVLEGLPEGFETILGENGGLVSGGEGQRVRFARSLARPDAKLAILDEPFRGLDHEKRRRLLERARHHWRNATLLCITHDIAETRDFDHVLVIENGTVSESGTPRALSANPESRYFQLLAAEEQARADFWRSPAWRRVQIHGGRLSEEMPLPQSRTIEESEVA
jgi:ATP-binding cassette subfamily B protein